MIQYELLIYSENYRYLLKLDEEKTYEIKGTQKANLTLPISEKFQFKLFWEKNENKWQLKIGQQSLSLTIDLTLPIKLDHEVFYFTVTEKKSPLVYDLSGYTQISISDQNFGNLQLPIPGFELLLKKSDNNWLLDVFNSVVFINNVKQNQGISVPLKKGDEISFQNYVFKVFKNELHVIGRHRSKLPYISESRYGFYKDYPDYHRSPRIIFREPTEKITIAEPPNKPGKPTEQLLRAIIPPLVMLTVMGLMAFFRARGIYVLAMGATTVVTMIFSISSYMKSRKKYKQDLKDRINNYHYYASNKSIELHSANEKQKKGQLYHYPTIKELVTMGEKYHHRIYEKTPQHFDFLYYRLGLGNVKATTEVTFSNSEKQRKLDELEQEALDLYLDNLNIEDAPIVANLMHGPVGYIGPRSLVIEQLHLLVNQLAFFHSYWDLQIISVFPEEEADAWQWMRWFPHTKLQDMNVRGFVYHQRSRDQVLNSLNQILKNRKNILNENKGQQENMIFSPHYLLIITDETLVMDHGIMEFLNEDPTELGCSVIFVEDVLSSLSENVKTIIDIRDRNTGELVIEEGEYKSVPFKLDHFPENLDKEELPRLLAPLNHLQNLKSSIPESVTFMEMYNVDTYNQLKVVQRWQAHSPHKSLAVPLGLRGKDDIVYLNLHEKAHGPHGLIAGTTGSGKSEIIQSYILSLAVNFHPYDVAFLLIDYKGGGMANLFRNLPHLLGTITNLDGAQSMRALISINAELKRRQRLFSENNVNHINQYQKLYKDGEVKQPMPHLFLISDEFAELKSEQPDFMKELISTARIGRSLGIHLILATQKPSGVVNDQIWSNSRFKLALKVADKSDSNEILKTPDAAEITQAGRAYLQVGNNEIYELFQSAWSGADYQPEKAEQDIEDHTIYAINELGQYEILNEDLSGLDNVEEIKEVPTELDAVIDGIHETAEKEKIAALPRPWLPPLPKKIYLPKIHPVKFRDEWQKQHEVIKPVIGTVDIPSMQLQRTLNLNLTEDGHIAIFSSPGYGKSTFLQTVIMDLARMHDPEHVQFYLIDFGTNGLLPLRGLPHVIDTVSIDENAKIMKFTKRIQDELKRRKDLLSKYAVANLDMYKKASGNNEPSILFILDSFEGFKNAKFEEDFYNLVLQIVREGASVGLYMVLSASRQNSLRMNLVGNIKTQLSLKLIDESETRQVVGKNKFPIDDIAGRGLVKLDEAELFQVALPAEGEDALDIIENIRAEVKEMDEYWTGERPIPIPLIPEVLDFAAFKKRKDVQKLTKQHELVLGLEYDEVLPFAIDFKEYPHLVVIGENRKIFDPLKVSIQHMLHNLADETQVVMVDTGKLCDEPDLEVSQYISDEEDVKQLKDALLTEVVNRNEQSADMFVYITDMENFEKQTGISDTELQVLLKNGEEKNIHFIIAGYHQYLAKIRVGVPKMLKDLVQTAALAMKLSDQAYVNTLFNSRELVLAPTTVYVVMDKQAIKVKYPSV